MLKCQFHCHSSGDPTENIQHSSKQLIKEAARLKYEVLSITCHRKMVFSKQLQKLAAQHNILLIPGAEIEINRQHILMINCDREAEKIRTFDDLKNYKNKHPFCLTIAPHPFFPGPVSLKDNLIKHIDLFDAIEISFAYSKLKNYNERAIKVAKKYKKPLISTSDCHILKYLDLGFCKVASAKNTEKLIDSIRKNKIENHHQPISTLKVIRIFISTVMLRFKKAL